MAKTRTRFRDLTLAPIIALVAGLLLAGCKSDSDSAGPGGGAVTVTGTVIDGSARPVANAPVVITGRPATATDANGAFTVTDVPVPYDVTVILSTNKSAITYKGVTRPDPTLYFTGFSLVTPNSATISGTVSGGAGLPLPLNHLGRVVFVADVAGGTGTTNVTTGAYSLATSWTGAATITGTLHALQWETAGGLPSAYKGYAAKTGVAVTNGGTFAGQNIALSAPSASTVAGSVTVPAGMTLTSKSFALRFNDFASLSLGSDGSAATTFNYNVPTITGASVALSANASSASLGSTSTIQLATPGASGIAITLQAPPQPSLPVNAATGITTTTPFSWTPVAGGVHVITFNPGAAGEPTYIVVTTGSTATIPDLAAQGLALGASKPYNWQAISFGPFGDMNAATGPSGLAVVLKEGWRAYSLSRSFTTAP